MARTEQEIASDINAKNEVKILEALKDYFAKKYNTNFDNIKLNLDAIKNALNGLSGIKEHLGVPHVPSSTAPTNPNEYDWYFDISTNKFMMYHNSAWVVIADLANLINLDAKYLKISDAQRDYAQTNNVNAALDGKADKSTTYTKAEIDSTLGGRAHVINVLTDNEKSVLAGVQFTSDEKSKLSKVVTTDTQQDISGKADITYVDGELAKKQAIIIGKPATVLAANPFTDEEKAKVTTAVQPAAISDVLRTGDVYTNAEIDSKVATASGQFAKGTIAELNDAVNGAGVTSSNKKVLVIDDLKKMVENQNLINKGSFVNFVDKVIYKDNATLEYFDTVLNIEVKDAAATTTGTIMTLSNPLDVYGRISVEGTSFGAVFEVPCAVEYNFSSKNKGVKFYGTKGQDYKWELISKYENDIRVNYVKFEGTSTMSVTDNPGASATWTTVTMPYEVKMDTLFDKDDRNANINIDYNPSLPVNGTHILDLEYYTTIPYLEARIANIIAQIQKDIASATPNFTPEQQAVLAANAFTDAYKGKLDNAPDNINTKLGEKLDVSTYNTDKSTFLTSTDISGKADRTYVDTELGKKQDKLSTTQLVLLASDAIKFTQVVDDRITANRTDIINIKGKGAFLGKFADATARDAALAGTTLVNGDYVILGDPAVRWVYDLRSTSWVEDISHSAAISSITLQDVASVQDPKIATAKQEAITSANTHTDGAITTLTNTVNGKQDSIDAGKLALLDGAVKFTQADKTKVDGAIQAHQDISGKANVSLDNISISGNVGKIPKVGTNGKFTYVDMPIIPDVSGFETSTDITRKINDKFTEQSDKLTSNNTDAIPGEAKIGHGYKGVQSYGEAASVQHYGKGAINTVNIGEGTSSTINIGKNSTGSLFIGSGNATNTSNQLLIHGIKHATFEKIIDVSNANPFTSAYKSKIDTALQQNDISGKADRTYVDSELTKKQDNLSVDQSAVVNANPFTNDYKTKVDSAVQTSTLGNYYTSAQVDTELVNKQDLINNVQERLMHNDSNAATAIIRKNSSYNSQSHIDNSSGHIGVFSGDSTKYATVKLDGSAPKLFGSDGATQYDIPFSNIQTKLNTNQMNVVNATPFTQAEKTKLANTASSTDAAAKANKDLSNIVTDQEKADFISNLTRIGVQVALFNEFKGVLPSDPTGSHNDLDWYINDTTYVIKVWHNNSWHDIGRPDHVLTKAEVITALGLTQTDIDNLKYLTNVRSSFSTIISKANEISHLPANTITALNAKADEATVNSQIATKLDSSVFNTEKARLNSAISGKADASALAGKANASDVYAKTVSDGKYATKTELAGKQNTIPSTQLLDSSSTSSKAYIKVNGSKKSSSYIGVYTDIKAEWSASEYASLFSNGDGPKLVGKHGPTKYEIPFSDLIKTKSLTDSAVANAKLDHSLYALKSEVPAEVDIKNSVYYIDGKIFSGTTYGIYEYTIYNKLKIYNDFWMGGLDGILNKDDNEPRGIRVPVNNALRGWQTLVRVHPGSQGSSMAFDILGYYDTDGGITKLKAGLGGASSSAQWSYVRENITFKAIAVPSKKWADVTQSYLEWNLDSVAKKDLSNVSQKALINKLPKTIANPLQGEWVKVQFSSNYVSSHAMDIFKLMTLHDIDMYIQDTATGTSGGIEIPIEKDYVDRNLTYPINPIISNLKSDIIIKKKDPQTQGKQIVISKSVIEAIPQGQTVNLATDTLGNYGIRINIQGTRTLNPDPDADTVSLSISIVNPSNQAYDGWIKSNLLATYSVLETKHIVTAHRRNIIAYSLENGSNIKLWASDPSFGTVLNVTNEQLSSSKTLNIEFFRKPDDPRIRLQNGREVRKLNIHEK